MTFLKTLTTALVGLSFAAAAHADEKTFQVEFKYLKGDPASVTYASFEEQAARACNREAVRSQLSGPSHRYHWNRKCTDELLDKAVEAVGSPALMALHEKSAPPTRPDRQVAAR